MRPGQSRVRCGSRSPGGNQGAPGQQGEQAHGYIQPEQPAPGGYFEERATQARAERRPEGDHQPQSAHQPAQLVAFGGGADHRLPGRHHDARGEALQKAGGYQGARFRCQGAQH